MGCLSHAFKTPENKMSYESKLCESSLEAVETSNIYDESTIWVEIFALRQWRIGKMIIKLVTLLNINFVSYILCNTTVQFKS